MNIQKINILINAKKLSRIFDLNDRANLTNLFFILIIHHNQIF